MKRSVLKIARRPVCWLGFFFLPLFCFLFFSSMMYNGLPTRAPAAIVDKDGSSLSRQISQTLGSMQMVDVSQTAGSYSEALRQVREGKTFGFFLIPENFEADLLAGRRPVLTFYTNMTYFVPASLLFRTFKTTALMSKAGVAVTVLQTAGANPSNPGALLQPVAISSRGLHNPGLNYAVYLNNSFLPGCLELMIMLMTVFTLGEEIKRGTSRRLLEMADGSILKAVAGVLLPQTVIWIIIVVFLESWLYGWMGYPMNGSWFWLTLSEVLFVLASQAFGLLFLCAAPNLRLALSACALLGILALSIAAFSFPVESMYGAVGIFSYILPVRYNFLIYIDQALNGIPIYYSRWWFVAYFAFILAPLPLLWNLKRAYRRMIYAP